MYPQLDLDFADGLAHRAEGSGYTFKCFMGSIYQRLPDTNHSGFMHTHGHGLMVDTG